MTDTNGQRTDPSNAARKRLTRRSFVGRGVVAAAAIGALALGDRRGRLSRPAESAVLRPELMAGSNKIWGLYEPRAPWDLAVLDPIEQACARKPDLVHWFQPWTPANIDHNVKACWAVGEYGATPLLTLMPDYPPLREAGRGEHDELIRQWARALKSYPGPIQLRFGPEMNLPHWAWSVGVDGNTEADYVAGWRRVREIFWDIGVGNVSFVWAPNIGWEGTTPYDSIYPGDDYLDWIGLTGYNGGDALPWGGWLTLQQVVHDSYVKLDWRGKPMMLTEWGSVEQGGDKAQWIRDAFTQTLLHEMPAIKGVVWFNESAEVNWRFQSSPESEEAFRESLQLWLEG